MEIEDSNNQEGFEGQQDPISLHMDIESNISNTEEKQPQPSKYYIDEDPFFPLNNVDRFVSCAFCNKNITNTLHFQCHECTNFFICKDCMLKRCENETHKCTHGYHVNENLKKKEPFVKGWTADEELRLLEGQDVFRFGNWEEISAYVGSKTEKHCVDHYIKCYLQTDDLLPNSREILSDDFVELYTEEEVPPYTGPGHDINGYSVYRNDYDVEYDNDAELMLKDVEILGDEDEREKELKTCIIRAFNRRLDEREKRKQFVLERGLLNLREKLNEEKKESKERQDINNRLKPFARFMTSTEYDNLLKGLLKEAKLRERILILQSYRKNGVRTLEDAEKLEREKKGKENEFDMNRMNGLLDVSHMDGAELLMPEEKELCSRLHLVPRHYLSIKSTIIQECCKNGMISKEEVGKRITIDVERKEKVYDFFISCGWITTGNHIHDMNYECFFQTNILILLCFSIPSSTKTNSYFTA